MIRLSKPYIEQASNPVGYSIVIPYAVEPPPIKMTDKEQERWLEKWEKCLDEQQESLGQELIWMERKSYSYEQSSWIGNETFRFDGGIDNFEKHAHRIRVLIDYVNTQIQSQMEIKEAQRIEMEQRLTAAWA